MTCRYCFDAKGLYYSEVDATRINLSNVHVVVKAWNIHVSCMLHTSITQSHALGRGATGFVVHIYVPFGPKPPISSTELVVAIRFYC
jgi:hypothetical protein